MRIARRISLLLTVVAAGLVLGAGVAGAQTPAPDPYVAGVTTIAPEAAPTTLAPVAPQVQAASVTAAQVKGSSLAFTGGDIAGLTVAGLVAIALGGFVVLGSRRRATVA